MAIDHQDSGPAVASGGQGVGALLRETRLRHGEDIGSVAIQLRIRLPYLQAIEDGRHHDLPGSTYAIGFVRGYAEYLGLDSEEIVRRFKQEMGGGYGGRTSLSFPAAMSENSIPSVALLAGALALAGAAYGAWYWYQGYADATAESVAALPDRLAALIHQPTPGTGGESVPPGTEPVKPATAKPGAPAAAIPAQPGGGTEGIHEEIVPPSDDDGSSGAAASPAVPAPVAPAPAVATPAPAPASPPAVAEPAKPPVEPARIEQSKLSDTKSLMDLKKLETKPVETVTAGQPVKSPETMATPGGTAPEEAAAASPAGADTTAQNRPAGQAGEEDKPSRITLRADEDCWIDIRDSGGQLVVSRQLHKGEVFAVPGRPGLKLTAGNAGALTVILDGGKSQVLGRPGAVRRDVALEPDRILRAARPARSRRPPARQEAPAPAPAAEAPAPESPAPASSGAPAE